MHGIVLVGGEGTRLRPLTYRTPKAMVPILGRPFLEHMLVYLRGHGVTTVSLALGHMPDPIRDFFGDGSRWGIDLRMVVEPQPLGSAGAIKQFQIELDEPFFAFNGDILTNIDLTAMRTRHARTAAAVSIALMEVDDPSGFGVVALDGEQRIRAFIEKPPREQAPSRWANAGIWLFEPSVLDRVPDGRRSMVETELFPELIADGEHVQGYCQQAFWVDIGTPERYLDVQLRLLDQPDLRLLPLEKWPGTELLCAEAAAVAPPVIAADAHIEGAVLLGSSAIVESGAVIVGPAAAGRGSHIDRGARLERSVLWDSCELGEESWVVESVLASGVRAGRGVELQRVFAGHAAIIPDGAALHDARLEPDAVAERGA